tara:strand:+ start:10137 stop:13775 length:3639 start_codon:yes stop_codon:yes gene_type:complete
MSLKNKALFILFSICISNVILAQKTKESYPEKKQTNETSESYNTWSLGAGFTSLKTFADLTSFYNPDFNLGGYLYVDKMFNPIIGMEFKIDYSALDAAGKGYSGNSSIIGIDQTIYGNQVLRADGYKYGFELDAIINLSNIWRLNSKHWSLYFMGGVGCQLFNSKLYDESDNLLKSYGNDGLFSSFHVSSSFGVRYRINKMFDIELRPTVTLVNDDTFDAAISQRKTYETFLTTHLGIVYKFGKEKRSAIWANKEDVGEDKFKVIDTDEDGVIDEVDQEPETPKEANVYGNGIAIDTDKDGVPDYLDKCPLLIGVGSNYGCPEDKDGDGVFDYDDACPDVAGSEDSLGCPKGQTPDDITNRIFLLSKSIYFKSGSDQIKGDSYTILNEIANIMLQYPNTQFNIDGHTDNTASASFNLQLSEKRAASVLNYLSEIGVREERLYAKGYGIEKPKHSNNTAEGRERNRRVEINYIQPDSENGKNVYSEGINVTEALTVLQPQTAGMFEDSDSDGVADVLDQEPDTFFGSLVYGNGVAIDTDKDGVIDLFDKCPFAPGTVENEGCPIGNIGKTDTNNNDFSITDTDGDGVMDILDADNNTPLGAKVYGNGIAIDTDNDGIIDLDDSCPLRQGTQETNGCPQNREIATASGSMTINDADGDGVIDSLDQEPNTPLDARVYGNGVAVDTDGDGIADHLDMCPLRYGSEEKEGCPASPDNDGDGVPNEYDKEPATPFGVKVYGNGVAMDTDSDGTPDHIDACPLKPGESSKGGCPEITDEATGATIQLTDSDKDGVIDQFDVEANTPSGAKVYGNGMSVDSDNDGIADHSDKCPNESGTELLSGCAPEKKVSIEANTNISASNSANSIIMVDSDNDGVMDQFDKDPNTPEGASVYGNGIPIDSDRDGLPDYKDKCPLKSGPVEQEGCPDTEDQFDWSDSDGDGVVNQFDKEPNTPADARVYGNGVAVDSDYDDVPDYMDSCPFESGTLENKGCPEIKGAVLNKNNNLDTDKDGIMDQFDKEPNTPYGVKVYSNGVSLDSDKDEVPDYKDRCPLLKGLPENEGCPKKEDLDGDGVSDKDDLCPDVFGTTANNGCPDKNFDKSVFLRIEASAQKIYFERTKNTLTTQTTDALDEISIILEEYTATKFEIGAHTDNKHNEKYSLFLSKRRANAIMKYLIDGGINEDRLSSEGYGDTQPKYSNTSDLATSELNNRVEFNYKTD